MKEKLMPSHRVICFALFVSTVCANVVAGQEFATRPAQPLPESSPETITLRVPANTPLQVALDREVRVKKAGQPIHGRIVEPVYAFDHLVIPAGTEVNGRISNIERVSGGRRTLGVLNADLTPVRKVAVEFNELLMSDGKHIPLNASITPGSGQVMHLVSTQKSDKTGVKSAASGKIAQAKDEAKRQWNEAIRQLKEPGKLHRLERYAMGQLPARPQYLTPGTLYFAELREPLDFGSEPATPQLLAAIGSAPPPGSVVHALLTTPLDSAASQKGEAVEAVITQPLFDGDRLIFPEGSRLRGVVLQAQPAGLLRHNGKLRITFREIVPPEGVAQKIVSTLQAVQSGEKDHVKLDSEGGAEASTPKTRYASTAITLALASSSFHEHNDADDVGQSQSQHGVVGGAVGFRLVGIVLSVAVKSQALGMAMGAYGASRSVYSNFIARGSDVIFPKNTAMEIEVGSRPGTVLPSSAQEPGQQ